MLDNINFQQINRNKFDTGHKTPANKEATRFNNLSLTPPSEFLLQAENPIHKVTNKQLSELNSNSVLRPASAQVVAGSRGTRGALGKEGLNSHNLLNGLQLANAGKASAVNNDVTTKATQVTERANKLINKYKINMQGYKVGYIERLKGKNYRGGYYDSLSPNFTHYQKRVDQGNYRR